MAVLGIINVCIDIYIYIFSIMHGHVLKDYKWQSGGYHAATLLEEMRKKKSINLPNLPQNLAINSVVLTIPTMDGIDFVINFKHFPISLRLTALIAHTSLNVRVHCSCRHAIYKHTVICASIDRPLKQLICVICLNMYCARCTMANGKCIRFAIMNIRRYPSNK